MERRGDVGDAEMGRRILPSPRLPFRVATGLVGLATKVVYAELNSYNGFHQKKPGQALS